MQKNYNENEFDEILNLIKNQDIAFNFRGQKEELAIYAKYSAKYESSVNMNYNNINMEITFLTIKPENQEKEDIVGLIKISDQENKEIVTLTYGLDKKKSLKMLEGIQEFKNRNNSYYNPYILLFEDVIFTPEIHAFINNYEIENVSEVLNNIDLSIIKKEIKNAEEKKKNEELEEIKLRKKIKDDNLTVSMNNILKKIEAIKLKEKNKNVVDSNISSKIKSFLNIK